MRPNRLALVLVLISGCWPYLAEPYSSYVGDTGTDTEPQSDTGTVTDSSPGTDTGTASDTASDTDTGTASDTDTGTASDTASDTDTATDTASDTGTGPASITPIYQLREGLVAPGSVVTIEATVVGGGQYGVDVQGGTGDFDGLWIYLSAAPLGNWETALPQGARVRVTGTYGEYSNSGLPNPVLYDETLSELVADINDVTLLSSGSPYPAVTLPTSLWTSGPQLDPYEGLLVTIDGPFTVTAAPNTYSEWMLDDLYLIDNMAYSPGEFTADFGVAPTPGQTFTALTGILYYDHGEFRLAPRQASDFQGFTP